ncbi:hypothetical protein [Absidia glauca]|uniref:Phosphatidate phosphatase APP1 catalytic domain-containing protein n=1 Tax=Absidia glauca TaxID=4829 RepID=A0A163JW40_ABSGL|nr:hypothetical protein [Absidia glauca]
MTNDPPVPRIRRRDRIKSLATSTAIVIKQEVSKYYEAPSPSRQSSRSISTTGSNGSLMIDPINDNLQCIIFPTYAVLVTDDEQRQKWKVRLSGWTFALPGSSRVDRWMLAAGRTYGGLASNSVEYAHFTNLFNQFRCQTMRGIEMMVGRTGSHLSDILNSGPNGRFEHLIFLDPEECADRIQHKYLELETRFVGLDILPQIGYVDIIDRQGVSVISDIDDTIKVTDILDGKDVILQNTFFRKAKEIPGMANVYQSWAAEGVKVHYVSNSPWQVYPALQEFLKDNKFPQGSIHLRLVSAQSLILGKPGQHKLDTISALLEDFPERKFVLVGDSGEIDPEIFAKIYHRYPGQIVKIFIHDVTSERAMQADRQTASRSESFYDGVKKLIAEELGSFSSSSQTAHITTSSEKAMEAMLHPEIPEEQQQIMDPTIPLKTKLEQFEQRMYRVSGGMRYGVFSVFSLASQLLLDPEMAEELHMMKSPLT